MNMNPSPKSRLIPTGTSLFLSLILGHALPLRAQTPTPAPAAQNITLPHSDSHYLMTRDYVEDTPVPGYHHASPAAFEAFRDLKYGVRIHWGIYSILGQPGESWPFLPMSFEQKQAYQQLYKTWDPIGFDAEEWMQLFQDSGMKMFAFTAKHHEGFSMFDTKTRVKSRVNWTAPGGPALEACDLAYSIMETPFHRDVVKELCDAGHKHGLAIDLYFSNPDWYDADFRPYSSHPIAIANDPNKPPFQRKALRLENAPAATPEEQARMMTRYREQLTELLTNYGKIDMLCLDMYLGKAVWPQMRDTVLALRKIQPDVMLRARGIGNYGDYYTPERVVPGGKGNTDMPWFVIYPLAKSFSYDATPSDYKGGSWIVRTLVDVVAKGGSFMVGIGPDGNGKFSPTAIENLKTAGEWLKVNGQGIYATRPREGDLWQEGKDIRFTQTKDHRTIYAFALKWPGQTLHLKSIQPAPSSKVYLLGYSTPLDWTYTPEAGTVIQLPAELQDPDKQKQFFVSGYKIEPSLD